VPTIGIGAGLLLAVAVTVVLVATGHAGRWVAVPPESAPAPAPALSTAQPEPLLPNVRESTVAAAAEFAAAYQPPGAIVKRMVAANVNAERRREIVFASIAEGVSRMDVAAWDGRGYRIVGMGQGGPATEIVDLVIRDVTRDGVREIILLQRTEQSRSVSIWGWDGARYAPQTARGGCADGRNTFGVNGAEAGVGTIIATCDASPRPSKNVYIWDRRANAWVFTGERS
jgi:hypothetical protein